MKNYDSRSDGNRSDEMFDRVFSHYLDAIDDADTAIFVVKEFVRKMSIDEIRLECEHLDKQDEGSE